MSNCDRHVEFDSRIWDVHRLLWSRRVETARAESALLRADAQSEGVDWVVEQLQDMWAGPGAPVRP